MSKNIFIGLYFFVGIVCCGHFIAKHYSNVNQSILVIPVTIAWPGYVSFDYFSDTNCETIK